MHGSHGETQQSLTSEYEEVFEDEDEEEDGAASASAVSAPADIAPGAAKTESPLQASDQQVSTETTQHEARVLIAADAEKEEEARPADTAGDDSPPLQPAEVEQQPQEQEAVPQWLQQIEAEVAAREEEDLETAADAAVEEPAAHNNTSEVGADQVRLEQRESEQSEEQSPTQQAEAKKSFSDEPPSKEAPQDAAPAAPPPREPADAAVESRPPQPPQGKPKESAPKRPASSPAQRAEPSDRSSRRTKDNIESARAVTRQALALLSEEDPAKAKKGAKSAEGQGASGLRHFIKKKVSAASEAIKAVEDRIDSLDDTMRQVGECMFQLQRAMRSKFGPLSVCERRLELREGRPSQEKQSDGTQQALEREKTALEKARQELSDLVQTTKEMLINLEEVRGELAQALAHKRATLKSDRSCFSPRPPLCKTPVQEKDKEKVVLPKVPNSPRDSQLQQSQGSQGGGEAQEHPASKADPKTLLSKAAKMQEDALQLMTDADAVILRTQQETASANVETIAAMSIQHRQTNKLRKQLEAQLADVDATILASERLQTKTVKKLRDHEQPMRLLDKQFQDLRHMREEEGETEEGKRDPVRAELEAHLQQIHKSMEEQTAKLEATDKMLEQLREARQKLVEDLRGKNLVLKIEDTCLKVSPRKALELDRLGALGGRCKEHPRKSSRQQHLEALGFADAAPA
mmetsp:Transcript_13495/g.31753  ORF Transcript_13495/g.31753 Transcript_13495/m.31753 type:complete len:691 (+) Transcript_13495:109-2181(+)